MVIQLQPAVWKQVKGRKRRRKRGRMKDGVSGQKKHGGLVCPLCPDEHPRQIFCEWEHILGGYTSHFALWRRRRRRRWWRRGDSPMMSYEMKNVKRVSMCNRGREFWPLSWSGTSITVQQHWISTCSASVSPKIRFFLLSWMVADTKTNTVIRRTVYWKPVAMFNTIVRALRSRLRDGAELVVGRKRPTEIPKHTEIKVRLEWLDFTTTQS